MVADPSGYPRWSQHAQRRWEEAERNRPPSDLDDIGIFGLILATFVNLAIFYILAGVVYYAYLAMISVVYGHKVYSLVLWSFVLVGSAYFYQNLGSKKPAKWLAWSMLLVSVVSGLVSVVWMSSTLMGKIVSIGAAVSGIATAIVRIRQISDSEIDNRK